MRPTLYGSGVILGLALVLANPPAAHARRATCEEILDAKDRGLPVENIKRDFETTTARIDACAHSAARRAQLAERREHSRSRRMARRGVESVPARQTVSAP